MTIHSIEASLLQFNWQVGEKEERQEALSEAAELRIQEIASKILASITSMAHTRETRSAYLGKSLKELSVMLVLEKEAKLTGQFHEKFLIKEVL